MVKMSSLFLVFSLLLLSGESSRNFTIENKCDYTVWPGVQSDPPIEGITSSITGFTLEKGETRVISLPWGWVGNIWGRSFCSNSTGTFSCATGDCESGEIKCFVGPLHPVTQAEFILANSDDEQDFYVINLMYGYNLPMAVVPQIQGCNGISCEVNLTNSCPAVLQVKGSSGEGETIACMSACDKFNTDRYCCRGKYSTPETCRPSNYSMMLKKECRYANTFANDDDLTSAFSCWNSPNYVITFCPTSNTGKADHSIQSQTKNGILVPPSGSQLPKDINTNTKHKSSWKLKLIFGVSAGLTVLIIIIGVIIMKAKDVTKADVESVLLLKRYSYKSVKKMTNSFAHVLGKGGFGTVYKGKLPDNGRDVAVKILKETGDNGEDFINEVASMARTSHVNIVSLVGFCSEKKKRAIIFDFMPNGSLDKFLLQNMPTKMEWKTLYDIALGVSRGLEYLHNRCVSRIVHFDIKPQNILMDKDLRPKISDFGLAKFCKSQESKISMVDGRGTFGYISPEVIYNDYGRASHKSDVYSYGMVLLEMIGARNREKAENAISDNSSSIYFPDWMYKDVEERDINMTILGDQLTEEEEKIAKKMVLVGLWCIQLNPSDRPTMIKVIEMLEGNIEDLEVPPKPLLYRTERTIHEDINETSSFSFQLNSV